MKSLLQHSEDRGGDRPVPGGLIWAVYCKITGLCLHHSALFACVHVSCTHSAILLPSSRLEGCELAVKMTRPPLVWFMSLGSRPLLSPHSGSGSLGTHAALSPSCSGGNKRGGLPPLKSTLVTRVEEERSRFVI